MSDTQTADPANTIAPVTIDVVSDVVCPWCFIGKRRLEKALSLKPNIPVEVRFHPYFLNPWVPREGMTRDEYLTTKFGSPDKYTAIAGRVKAAAAAEGLTYAVDKMRRQPNTLDCHRLILWAQAEGKAAEMKQRLMDSYFTNGADLSDREVLVRIAAEVGLDPDKTRTLLASDADVEKIESMANSAKDAGIDGVPTFILGGGAAGTRAPAPPGLGHTSQQSAPQPQPVLARQ